MPQPGSRTGSEGLGNCWHLHVSKPSKSVEERWPRCAHKGQVEINKGQHLPSFLNMVTYIFCDHILFFPYACSSPASFANSGEKYCDTLSNLVISCNFILVTRFQIQGLYKHSNTFARNQNNHLI